jgi:hypothetical protein
VFSSWNSSAYCSLFLFRDSKTGIPDIISISKKTHRNNQYKAKPIARWRRKATDPLRTAGLLSTMKVDLLLFYKVDGGGARPIIFTGLPCMPES